MVTGSGGNSTYIDATYGNTINFAFGNNANDAGWINYRGYNGGTTQFRDLYIGDGKGVGMAFFDGSSGNLALGGTHTPNSAVHIARTSSADDVLLLEDSSGVCEAQPTTTGLTWSCSSDARLKESIIPAAPVLPYLRSLPLFAYDVIATGEHVPVGPVAQVMATVDPSLVRVGSGGFLTVSELSPWMLVKANQELAAKVETLEQQLATLLARVSALEKKE